MGEAEPLAKGIPVTGEVVEGEVTLEAKMLKAGGFCKRRCGMQGAPVLHVK